MPNDPALPILRSLIKAQVVKPSTWQNAGVVVTIMTTRQRILLRCVVVATAPLILLFGGRYARSSRSITTTAFAITVDTPWG